MPESAGKKRLTSTVVVSSSFRREQEKRDNERTKTKRERRYRIHHSSTDDEDERYEKRKRRDIKAHGWQRNEKYDDSFDDDDDDEEQSHNKRFNERNLRRELGDNWRDRGNRNQSASMNLLQSRRIVTERDPMSRGRTNARDRIRQVVTEVNLNPTDVPRGKRYFLHDDREVPRRQQNLTPRARSRSPVWKHDKFAEMMEDETNVKKEVMDTKQKDYGGRGRDRI